MDDHKLVQEGHEVYYALKGKLELLKDDFVEAEKDFRMLIGSTSRPDLVLKAYQGLYEAYHGLHITDSMGKYAVLYSQYNDSTTNALRSKELQQQESLYNYHRHINEAQRLKEANGRMRLWLLLLALTLVSVLATLLIVFISRRYRKQLRKSNLSKLELLRLSHEQFSAERELQAQSEIRNSAIYETIQRCIREGNDQTLSDEEWDLLSQTVNKAYKNFEDKLLGLVALNEQDYRICLLIKMNVKPIHIAQLTARSPEAISSSRRRLYERVTNTKGKPQDWDAIVHLL